METLICVFVASLFTCEATDRPRGDYEPIIIERRSETGRLTDQTWVYCTDALTCPIERDAPATVQFAPVIMPKMPEWQLSEVERSEAQQIARRFPQLDLR